MLWYILSATGFISSIFSVLIKNDLYVKICALFGLLFLITSIITTLTYLYSHGEKIRSLPKKKNEIKVSITLYQLIFNEFKEQQEKIFDHELRLIKAVSQNSNSSRGENMLSFNSNAQLSIGQSIKVSESLKEEVDSYRIRIVQNIRDYNDTVLEIMTIQQNSLINTPFIKKINIPLLQIEDFDDIEEIRVA